MASSCMGQFHSWNHCTLVGKDSDDLLVRLHTFHCCYNLVEHSSLWGTHNDDLGEDIPVHNINLKLLHNEEFTVTSCKWIYIHYFKDIKHVEASYEAYIMIRQSISWLHFLSDEYMYRKVENHQVSMSVCVREFYRTSSTIKTITIVNIHLV